MNNKEVEEEHIRMRKDMEKNLGMKSDGFKIKAIGYLDITEPDYQVGEVPKGFIEKLKQIYHNGIMMATMGCHDCEFCINQGVKELPREAKGSCEKHIIDKENKIEYWFPEMIFHYIKVHMFKPDDDFIKFVMSREVM